MTGKLYGVGVGPGDPGFLTYRAGSVLEEADVICPAAAAGDKESLALKIAGEAVDISGEVEKLIFPMTSDKEEKKRAWKRTGERVIAHLKKARDVAFITLGDPLLYSTYIYLLEEIKDRDRSYPVETVPGVTAVTGCGSSLNLPLVRGEERMAVVPAPPSDTGGFREELKGILAEFEAVVILKPSRRFEELKEILQDLDLLSKAVLISRSGRSKESIAADRDLLDKEKIDYLSTLIITKNCRDFVEKGD